MRWLDRTLLVSSFCYGLCLSEADFIKTMKSLKVPANAIPDWIKNDHSDATVHYIEMRGKHCAIVCMRNWEDKESIAVAGLLVHEAVHIWQQSCIDYGELHSAELEAYSIQNISQQLMLAFDEARQ